MAFKKWQKLAEQSYKVPRKLKDVIVYWTDNDAPTYFDLISAYSWETMPPSHKLPHEVFNMLWNNPNEYESALISLLCERLQNENTSYEAWIPYTRFSICAIAKHIYVNYGERILFEKYFENYETWDNSTNDRNYLNVLINRDIQQCIYSNRYKWGNLFKSCVLEFNPLWNVDGVETTTRTLEQDGTETRTKTGTETDRTTGTETTEKTGTETTTKRGTVSDDSSDDYFEELDGSDVVAHTGTETTAYTGSEIDTLSGSDSVTQTGTVMHGTQKTTTESATFYDTEKVTDTYNTPTTTLYGKSDTKAFSNRSDTVTDNKTDTTTYGKKMTSSRTIDADTSYNTTDTLTHAVEDELTHNTTSTLTHNTSDALLRDLLDTERITKERHGNIGVTTTTSLLEEFRAYVDFNIMDVIAKDIVNTITEGVY